MKTIIDVLVKETGIKTVDIEKLLEIPPKPEMGDFAFPCFELAKIQKKNPLIISQDLVKKLRRNLPSGVTNVDFNGAYVNFFTDKTLLAMEVLKKLSKKNFGSLKLNNKNIGIEYPAPNTNKSLHIGHLRNMAIGESITNINKNVGNKVFHLNLFNDRGILICKSMIAYEKYAKDKTPESEGVKGDKFVGELYIRFSKESLKNPKLEELAKEKLRDWEAGDISTRKLWSKMNSWVYSGMQETFDKFGLSPIVKNYFESEIYAKGRKLVEVGLANGLFLKKNDGAVFINLKKEKLGEKILLRSDGTSVYMTQDLFLAEQKVNDFNLDDSYYVVGCDQEYHFKVLFSILKKMKLKKGWKHLSYGMVSLPTGKMKSREGSAVSADDLINETQKLARKGIIERMSKSLDEKELDERSLKIALAAIKYALLKVDIHKGIVFNPKDALAFEGDTGPYLLYSYARASSIIRKVKSEEDVKILNLKNSEIKLLKKMDSFKDVLIRSYESLAPNLIANYCFELAQNFNEFYHACPVMGSDAKEFRLKLIDGFRITLKKGLFLLGIETIEEM